MNEWERLRRQAQRYKENYPPGTRVMLLSMEDPWAPVPSGTRGTVEAVDDIGQLHMKWDNGRTLALVPGEDSLMGSEASSLLLSVTGLNRYGPARLKPFLSRSPRLTSPTCFTLEISQNWTARSSLPWTLFVAAAPARI